ncbi:MAG: diguanylate cyclase [Alphaproteobacteria bacterium]|jgi:dihydroxyacetone kinase DhaKLM complex PTS-EIIA-like component DhaM|nr:diguanylate cyclase [Alphaproteobacteria bacterium]
MANLVVVSHSFALAAEVIRFAKVMSGNKDLDYKIINASGMDGDTFGTDGVKINQAVMEGLADSDVLIFHEIGSSILSAEMAVEMLEEGFKDKVVLARLPLVESLFVALNVNSKGMKAVVLQDILRTEIRDLFDM